MSVLIDGTLGVTANSLTLPGTTSGSMRIQPDAVMGASTLTIPAANGTLITSSGRVLMLRTGVGTWTVRKTDGNTINISASTTSGLQEAINEACANGYDLYVYGGGIQGNTPIQDVAVINCTTGITFPAMQNKRIEIGACSINFTAAVSGNGVTFDSCMMVYCIWSGQIVYTGNNAAVLFKPTANVPYDLVPGCLDSHIRINHIATVGGTNPICVKVDATNAAVLGTTFEFIEVNGSNVAGTKGVILVNPTAGIIGNKFRLGRIHKCKTTGVAIGEASTTSIYANMFEGDIWGAGGTTQGILCYGANNQFRGSIVSNEGTLTTGLSLGSSAAKNLFTIPQNDANTGVTDSSTTKDNQINGSMSFSWTPVFTFATPGNLTIVYSVQVGWGTISDKKIDLTFTIVTSTFTHSTASGIAQITGLPFTSKVLSSLGHEGSLGYSGVTSATFSHLTCNIEANSNTMDIRGSASAQAFTQLTPTSFPTGGTLVLRGTITYWKD